MAKGIVLFSLLPVLVLLFSLSSVSGIVRSKIISKEDELEIEEQLKVLNKRPVKSIKVKNGDIFDCIDINEQPSLDHPLLKNHKVQTKPTLLPKGGSEGVTSQTEKLQISFIVCPEGTVPIRRTRKKDLIRAKRFISIPPFQLQPGLSRAFVYTYEKDGMFGARGWMNLINPTVEENQSVYSLISIDHNPVVGGDYETIKAGWAVWPALYGDSETRFITNWEVGRDGNPFGCWNTFCTGFIQVNKSFPINFEFSNMSSYNGQSYEFQVAIVQDQSSKNWWLTIPNESVKIGYWPSALVPHLKDGANQISWGGMTRTNPGGMSPPMGFGEFPDDDLRHSGYFRECRVFNKDGQESPPRDAEILVDNENCYKVLNGDAQFNYGGPGGDHCGA